jgi:predicted amidohydrolase YtcJ
MNTKRTLALALALALASPAWLGAQNTNVAARLGYPQLIVYNGKIVTMDDASFEARVGAIVQAMAIRDGKILATGSNAEVRAIAGPKTRSIDLKQRTVLPGLISTHEHPTSWAFIEPRAFRHALPNDDVVVARWMPSKPGKEQLAMFEPTMHEAVSKAKPGQWIMITFNYGPNYEWSSQLRSLSAEHQARVA